MTHDLPARMGQPMIAQCALIAAMTVGVFDAGSAAADAAAVVLKDGTIGYVMTMRHWSVYQTPNAETECPNGFNDGPREQFKILYPEGEKKWTILETHLERESELWFPSTTVEPYPYLEALGEISIGLNLDGRIDANDFTSHDGEEDIDNQLYRAIGCIANYRGPDGTIFHFETKYVQQNPVNRFLIELTGVDNLINDDDVTVTTYRGLDGLLTDATGKGFIPGGTQRIDMRWGKQYVQHFKGQIVDRVLTTEAADLFMPWSGPFQSNPKQLVKGLRFHLKLTPGGAEGLMAGYADIESWYYRLTKAWSTHHQSYGQESSPSLYRALHRLADAYPDPETGENTAISASMDVKYTQVFILHPPQQVVSKEGEQQNRVALLKSSDRDAR